MTTLTITIKRAQVLADIKVVSHAEVASVEDTRLRYLYEAGSDKVEQIHQCITDAYADAGALMRPFAPGSPSASVSADDTFSSSGDLVIVMSLTTRKAANLETPLMAALHKYVVDDALAKFYKGVNHAALQQVHEGQLQADISAVEALVYRRMKPTYSIAGAGTI